ncbi:hypothetical protein QCA50_011041 [Cerrena zonata]|uniref:C2 domain-containing protein n=1 Tax=Cerrena zonata TaxID=2478898 RepID=A0AAW0G2H1_9APHY
MSGELGTLVIVVLKARNLRDKHSFYKQDVYSKITINGITKKTAVEVKGGQHPVWDEEIRIPISTDTSEKARTLYASVVLLNLAEMNPSARGRLTSQRRCKPVNSMIGYLSKSMVHIEAIFTLK